MSFINYVIGIDEVGRGPLAGPLCVGACLITRQDEKEVLSMLHGVRDSKKLSPQKRLFWFTRAIEMMEQGRLFFVTSFVSPAVIDRVGISQTIHMGIRRCLKKLSVSPPKTHVMLDGGIHAPAEYVHQVSIIRGDEKEPLIALASIVAKVRRDRHMVALSRRFPEYGFDIHKGYGTKRHFEALRKYGLCAIHRRSFLKEFQISNT